MNSFLGTALNCLYVLVATSGDKGGLGTVMIRDTKAKTTRVQVPVPTITSWVTVGKFLNFSVPPFLSPYNENDDSTYFKV